MSYPDDLTFEQVINCKVSACIIHLIFVDFQIAEESIMEVIPCTQLINYVYTVHLKHIVFNPFRFDRRNSFTTRIEKDWE